MPSLSGAAVEPRVVDGVETGVDSVPALELDLLGPMALRREGAALELPRSRKVRGLIAYLALAPAAVGRASLCELLWDVPNDPRGELRWCLSKMRALLDSPGRPRLISEGDRIRLDLGDVAVDARELIDAAQSGLADRGGAALEALASRRGEFVEGLEIERSAPFSAWLVHQRRRIRAMQAAVLEQWVARLPPEDERLLPALEGWLELAPFDRRAHVTLLDVLARRGQLREGDEHLAAAARRFDSEGQDWAPIGHAWRAARSSREARVLLVPASPEPAVLPTRRASIVVMPFSERGQPLRGGLADGLAYDLISRLAKLRSMFVIAPGTAFALDERRVGADEAGRRLDVDYVASGSIRREAERVAVSVQLGETRSARVVWADTFDARADETLGVIDAIGDRIVSSIAQHIEAAERQRAVLLAPSSLDAWSAHHRGLWHMYRFDRDDNLRARGFFETAVRLDPTFSRPYAGLSFTHFQDAFLGWGDRAQATEQAYRLASQGLMADERDPAGHWALGRALWLRGEVAPALAALSTSVELSPNFALGHYTLAFVHAQSGDAAQAIAAADHSRELSPFDPLLFAMLASRALALLRLGRVDEAADWALKAIARPNAHVHILAIAVHCLVLADRADDARAVLGTLRRNAPGYRLDDLTSAFRFSADLEARLRATARRLEGG